MKIRKIKITFAELSDRFDMSDDVCNILGLNPYCLSEGLATRDDIIELSFREANDIGISKHEFDARAK